MADRKHEPEPTFKVVTTARNEIETAMIAGYLESAGIPCVYRPTFRGADRPKSIYVPEADLERAREVLKISSDAKESCAEPTQMIPAKDGDIEVPIPSRDDFLGVVRKIAGGGFRKRSAGKDRLPEQSD